MVDYSSHKRKEYIDEAVADGWTVDEGPWGSSEHDRSVTLKRELPEIDGSFLLWLVDRDYHTWDFKMVDGVRTRVDTYTPEESVNMWFNQKAKPGYAERQQGLPVSLRDLDAYDLDKFLKRANRCNHCGREIPANKLNRVGFADHACDLCLAEVRSRVEKPGWTN